MKRDILPGIVLIVVGLTVFVVQYFKLSGEIVPLALGLVFLAAYVARREYGFLVPAGILCGVGTGVALTTYGQFVPEDAVIVLSIAGGFLAIYVIDVLFGVPRPGRIWPLFPAGALGVVGVSLLERDWRLLEATSLVWPLVLMLIGVALILRRTVPAAPRTPSTPTEAPR